MSISAVSFNESFLEEYAYLVGKIIGDGNLDPKYPARFVAKDRDDLINLRYLLINKLKIDSSRLRIHEKKAFGSSYVLQVNYANFGRILCSLGAPLGNKTKISFSIPSWILNNLSYKRRFLQALLEDELTTIKIERSNYSVKPRLKMAKKPELLMDHTFFMTQVKEAIESFGVSCSRLSKPIADNKHGSVYLYFHINRNKENVLRFKESIGFRLNTSKVKCLNECCEIIKRSINS